MMAAGLSALVPAMAQDNVDDRLRVRVISKGKAVRDGKPTDIYVIGGNGNRIKYAESRESMEILELPQNAFKTLYFFETEDYLKAQQAMDNGKYDEAAKRFGSIVKKRADLIGVKDSPAVRGAVSQLECVLHLFDAARLKDTVANFQVKESNLTDKEQNDLAIAKILIDVADKKWADVKSQAESFLKSKPTATRLQQARAKYALGEAAMEAKDWAGAWDMFAQAVILLHGQDQPMGTACVKRSLDAYLAQPDMAEFVKNPVVAQLLPTKTPLPAQMMAERSMNLKEGAALYHLHGVIYPGVELPEQYNVFAIAHQPPHANKGAATEKKPEEAPAAPAEPAAPAAPAAEPAAK